MSFIKRGENTFSDKKDCNVMIFKVIPFQQYKPLTLMFYGRFWCSILILQYNDKKQEKEKQ